MTFKEADLIIEGYDEPKTVRIEWNDKDHMPDDWAIDALVAGLLNSPMVVILQCGPDDIRATYINNVWFVVSYHRERENGIPEEQVLDGVIVKHDVTTRYVVSGYTVELDREISRVALNKWLVAHKIKWAVKELVTGNLIVSIDYAEPKSIGWRHSEKDGLGMHHLLIDGDSWLGVYHGYDEDGKIIFPESAAENCLRQRGRHFDEHMKRAKAAWSDYVASGYKESTCYGLDEDEHPPEA